MRFFLGLAICFALGCSSSSFRQPIHETRQGPASHAALRRVVVMPSTCGSFLTFRDTEGNTSRPRCKALQLETVDTLVRVELDFRGFDVVAAKVNATTFSRIENISQQGQSSKSVRVVRSGSSFADVTPRIQDQIIKDLGADGLLLTRIWLGAGIGASSRHEVLVQVSMIDTKSSELVWARKCSIETNLLGEEAILKATRCAMAGTP